jgi:hypothetical protein
VEAEQATLHPGHEIKVAVSKTDPPPKGQYDWVISRSRISN